MTRRVRFVCLALFALCVPRALAADTGCPIWSSEARARTAEVLEAAFDASGFDVQRGAMWVFSHADIKPDCRDCSHANPSSTYGCAMLPVTDDPRGILRETRAAARSADAEDDGGTPVSSARRPRVSSSFGAARNVSDDTGTSETRGGSFVPDQSSSSATPRTTEASSSTRQSTSSVFSTLIGTRAFVRETREAAESLDTPALGLAKPNEAELERLRQTARVLPDASNGASFSCEWRLKEHEVVVLIGCTPPPAKYFGITPYVYKSYDGGQVRTLFASAGDTLSMGGDDSGAATFSRLGTSAGRVPLTSDGTQGVVRDVRSWNATFATAFGGHRNTLKEAIDALTNALQNENENENENESVSIPGVEAFANAYGLSRVSGVKTRALMIRHAVPSDVTRWRAYAEHPPFIVMRLTPKRSPTFPAPFPRAALIQRKTFDERPLASSVALVADRVAAFFERGGFDASEADAHTNDGASNAPKRWFDVPGRYTTRTILTSPQVLFDNGQRCLDVSWNCGGDNRDTTYVNGPRFRLPDDSTVAYVIGANHVATKNAVYANVAVYDPARKLGVLAIDDGEFENTAERWTRGTPAERDAPRLFVVALARKCPSGDGGIADGNQSRTLDGALCVEVPSDGFPSASPTAELAVWERPYCHAETTVGPWWSRLATPTVVLVRRVGDAPAQQTPFTFDVNTF